jgi:hypothetical protein
VKYEVKDPEPKPELLKQTKEGEHVWIAAAAFRLSEDNLKDSTGRIHMDRENLATIAVGCFICEQQFQQRLFFRKCPGEPKE